ncbi:MAG: hypothetical protein R2852_07890 [Bacteroidia bacterium]
MKTLYNILLISLLLFTQKSFSNHLLGGEITYKWKGGKKVEITLKYYRECQGVPFNNPSIYIFDYKKSSNRTLIPSTRILIQDLTIRCPDSTSSVCTSNQVSGDGVELHVYVSTINFDSLPYKMFVDSGICQIGIGTDQCCRSGYITNKFSCEFFIWKV